MTDFNYKYVLVNSFDRVGGSDTDPVFALNGTFREEFDEMALVGFVATNTFYNVSSSNNTLQFQERNLGVVYPIKTATVPVGNYTLTNLITALQTAMNSQSALSATFTITSSALTGKLTINISVGEFKIVATQNSLNLMLGFSRTTDTAFQQNVLAPRIYNLSRYGFFNLQCSLTRGDVYNTITGNRQNILASIPISQSNFGDIYSFRPPVLNWINTSSPVIDQITLRLTDDENNLIDLNGGYMTCILAFR